MAASLCCLMFAGVFGFVSADQKATTAWPKSGQNVTLTCKVTNSIIIAVKWSRADLGEEYVLYSRDGQFDPEHQHPSFKNRVDLQDRQMKDGDVSLILRNVTTDDAGTYVCRVALRESNKRPSLKVIGSIYLHVAPPGHTGGAAGVKAAVTVFSLLLLVAVGFAV